MTLVKRFIKYISLNILGMIGLSCYILADTFFISKAQGANGLTALNLALPMYNFIFAVGAMIGVGSAIRFAIAKSRGDKDIDSFFFQSLFFTTLFGTFFIIIGLFFPGRLLMILGADASILEIGVPYTRIFMSFAPIFMWNHVVNAFVRNDGAPSIAMAATLSSSLFNILFDYVLMFPLGMGMRGAAFATALSPVVGILICSTHFFSKQSRVRLKLQRPSLSCLWKSSRLGISAFVGEVASGIIMMTFNFLILKLAGNVGVAAYGVIANTALVAIAVFNGIAQGSQPLISECYGAGNKKDVAWLQRISLMTAFSLATLIYIVLYICTPVIVHVFNSEQNMSMQALAENGMHLYFIGLFFAGVNIVGGSYFSAVEKAKEAFIISVLRGFVLIMLFAFLLSFIWGLNGVWLSYVCAEGVTAILMVLLMKKWRVKNPRKWL